MLNDDGNEVMDFGAVLALLGAVLLGAFLAVVALPQWLPGLSASLLGAQPHAYWYLSRASAMVAYVLLWLSMVLGTLITNKLARLWPGGPVAFDLHQYTSWLGLAFTLFHALILLGDRYLPFSLAQALVPGLSPYQTLAVGLGQIALYALAVVALSFYARRWLGQKTWRLIHYVSFGAFLLALAHGLWAGTDTTNPLIAAGYWATSGWLLFLVVYRVLIHPRWQVAH